MQFCTNYKEKWDNFKLPVKDLQWITDKAKVSADLQIAIFV